jgi:hypothetical protein
MQCQDALPLVPSYLDGELSEAQAAPLREHLLDCQPCRGSAQDLKGLKRWFVPGAAVEAAVPSGFAARVARRAFAGDTGEHPEAALPERTLRPVAAGDATRAHAGYVRELTGLAAAVLVALTIGLRMQEVPSGERLRADEMMPFSEVQNRLEELNDDEAETSNGEAVDGTQD